MATKSQPAMDMSATLDELKKMLEQYRLPGMDTQEIMDARRKDIEALMQANVAILEGMQSVAQKQGELFMQSMADIQAAMAAATGGVSQTGKEGELARKAYEKVLADMKDLAEIVRASQADAIARINERANESAKEIKKALLGK